MNSSTCFTTGDVAAPRWVTRVPRGIPRPAWLATAQQEHRCARLRRSLENEPGDWDLSPVRQGQGAVAGI